ncbi:type IV secretion system protein [Phenylobacterium kunshanense]|uniref:Type IV secretion system protein VirB6 n=1 Tax=Phenylobacterium kunshanense TaxID=1445034 RepID=A0A328BK85_9CAUL|nr:type IV secretion system protein [Phenylobacterium kunshanense]RAK66406.1 type IV secretion system protein VirB6 [Phenylobacterium kunshanense]
MDGDFRIFSPAYAFIDGKLDQFLDAGAGRMLSEVAGPLRLAVVLYVLLYGFAILRGVIAEPIMDFAIRSVKLALVIMLATTAAYGDWISQPLFHGLPDTIARAVSGASNQDAGAAFDEFFGRAAYLGQKTADRTTPMNWVPLVVSGAVFVFGALAAALGFGIVVLSKVALALLVALGPAFVACSLFEATRRYFFGWLSQAVNYLVLFALMLAIFQLVLSLVGEQWGKIDGQDPVVGSLIFIALCLLGAIFFLQTPAIAAGIAGGASIGLADFGDAAGLRGGSGGRYGASSADGNRGFAPPQGGSIRQIRGPR